MQRPAFELRHLVALQALLEERHVSRAAQRLGLTQPAVSNSLAHLRAHFKDEFLIRKGNTLSLTPFAEKIQLSLEDLLVGMRGIAEARPTFDPAAAKQNFQIVAGETSQFFLPLLARRIQERAPHASVSCVRPCRDSFDNYRGGAIDLMILPEQLYLDDHPREAIMRDEWVCLVSQDNRLVGDALTAETYRKLRHILPDNGRPGGPKFVVLGFEPDVAVTAPPSLAPSFLPGTCYVATVPARVALSCPSALRLREFPVPVPVAPLIIAMAWHVQKQNDPVNAWLRDMVRLAAHGLGEKRVA